MNPAKMLVSVLLHLSALVMLHLFVSECICSLSILNTGNLSSL